MKFNNSLKKGKLIKRYKRFFVDVKLNKKIVTAHCPNTGSMKGLLDEGNEVYLDIPFVENEEEYLVEAKYRGRNVKLNKPFRTPGGPKKFAVYVKNPKSGNIKKVTFGDPNLRVRNNNKSAAKSLRAKHNCKNKKDRTKTGYWSCNISRYRKELGIKSSNPW